MASPSITVAITYTQSPSLCRSWHPGHSGRSCQGSDVAFHQGYKYILQHRCTRQKFNKSVTVLVSTFSGSPSLTIPHLNPLELTYLTTGSIPLQNNYKTCTLFITLEGIKG